MEPCPFWNVQKQPFDDRWHLWTRALIMHTATDAASLQV